MNQHLQGASPPCAAGVEGLNIVKLGGSLAGGPAPTAWLDAVLAGPGAAVIVPGGGPFADQVRSLQSLWDFSDSAAHHLALIAMEQVGYALAALRPGALVPAADATAIRDCLRNGLVPVWLPTAMVLARPEIPHSWAVTSDSLALWLGRCLGAVRVVLVKSAKPPSGQVSPTALMADGLVDEAFADFITSDGPEAWCLGPGDCAALSSLLCGEAKTGTRILPDG